LAEVQHCLELKGPWASKWISLPMGGFGFPTGCNNSGFCQIWNYQKGAAIWRFFVVKVFKK